MDFLRRLGRSPRVAVPSAPAQIYSFGGVPIVPPVILLEGTGYQNAFASVDDLLGYVEAIDVLHGDVDAFDAMGKRLLLAATLWPHTVTLTGIRSEPDTLRTSLFSALNRLAPAEAAELGSSADLADLVRAIWKWEHRGAVWTDPIG